MNSLLIKTVKYIEHVRELITYIFDDFFIRINILFILSKQI